MLIGAAILSPRMITVIFQVERLFLLKTGKNHRNIISAVASAHKRETTRAEFLNENPVSRFIATINSCQAECAMVYGGRLLIPSVFKCMAKSICRLKSVCRSFI